MCDASQSSLPLGSPVMVCTTLVRGKKGCACCEVDGIGSLLNNSSSYEALEDYELLDVWQPDIGRSKLKV